jgi:Protein of unknown function with PCYCGC motif
MKYFAGTIFLAVVLSACSAPAPGPIKAESTPAQTDTHDHSGRPDRNAPKPIPAFQSPESAKNLPKTLDASLFTGSVKAAYQVVNEIPETIAQLPCYCHCDRSLGHKSLYSCYVDDHAANCSVCMNSALKAYKLQKEKKMTPEQIRDELIKEYGKS